MVVIRSTFSLKTSMILLTMMSLLLFSIVKLRDNIPVQWNDQKIQDILKTYLRWQQFPLDTIPVRPVNSSHMLTFSQLQEFQTRNIGLYRNFYEYKIENKASDIKFDKISELEIFLNFQPMMSDNEKILLLYTFDIFLKICEKHGFDYFVIEGTLLGVYRHMGLIPWDDDLDVVMDASNWTQIRDAFSGNEEISLLAESQYQWKVFLKSAYKPSGKKFKWPFVDIFFYERDKTHIIGLTPSLKPTFIYKVEDIFPLALGPFENFQVYVPKKMDKFVKDLFTVTMCQTGVYLHKLCVGVPSKDVKLIPCSFLYNLYPFVFRSIDPASGKTVAQLKLGSKIIRDFKTI